MLPISYYMITIFITKLILISIIMSQIKNITPNMTFKDLPASLKASSILLLLLSFPAFYLMWINRNYILGEQRLIRYTGLTVDFIFSIGIVGSLFNISNTTVNVLNGLTSVGIVSCIFNSSYDVYYLYSHRIKDNDNIMDKYPFTQQNLYDRDFVEIKREDILKYILAETDSDSDNDEGTETDRIYADTQFSSDDELP